MAVDELELRFRLADGSDIGQSKYSSTTTVASLKEIIFSQWPQDKEDGPKSIGDIKLINAGRILENDQTVAASRSPLGVAPGGVITMHVVLNYSPSVKHSGKLQDESQNKTGCSCSIM